MRMCDLAEQAQLSRSGLTRLVDRLERDGLLERCSCEHDARGSYACLTDAGRERLEEARVTHLRGRSREQFFSHFSESELELLADMWERIAPCNGLLAPVPQPTRREARSAGSRRGWRAGEAAASSVALSSRAPAGPVPSIVRGSAGQRLLAPGAGLRTVRARCAARGGGDAASDGADDREQRRATRP